MYFTEKSFSMDILSNMIFWRGTGANLSLAKNEAGTFTCSGKMLLLDLKNPKAPLFSFSMFITKFLISEMDIFLLKLLRKVLYLRFNFLTFFGIHLWPLTARRAKLSRLL